MTDTMQGLNKEQLDAVQTINGPMLILAGAGSGKTKVLTCRIAHLLQQGVRPYRILAITFTNKAAAEMRERVDRMAGAAARDVWLFTFHAFCARLLRYELENLNGYANNFAIYDTSDSKNLIKQVLKEMNLDEKRFPLPAIISHISNAKNALLLPDAYAREASGYYEQQVAKIYDAYQKKLQANNAVDFDDLLLLALRLLQENP
ncbi:MAG: UvrD-helicase domain-containing protein, partial [Phascolarctobacterium succinatutens]|nr:UvrD-helicase domain-containing protein [Phascolarctobacterium succinatutens]